MNRFYLLTASLLVLCIGMWAGPVSKELAQQEAIAFLNGQQSGNQQVRRAPVNTSSLSAANTGTTAYYVFNVGEKEGFVIVSAEDSTEPILGFVEEGNFNMDEIPGNMKEWLKEYERQIEWARENGIERKTTPRRTTKTDISMMTKSKWNQRRPYNLYCYNETGDWYAVTGCVATAMAQIMYYHQWPEKTTGEIPAYDINYQTTETSYTYTWAAQPATTFEWTKMQDAYSSSSKLKLEDATEEEKAVAKLMRYCGQSVNMQYGQNGSAASNNSASKAFSSYFGYDEDVRLVKRNKYSTQDEWDELIYNELANGRPVLYGGSNETSGHAFIVDGYQDGMFSINWGWSGKHDGYFLLSALNPNDEGEAGTSSGGYNSKQDAIIGIQKPDGMEHAEGTVTDIRDRTNDADNGIWYNLNGVRVEQPTRGVYIRNGKKVVTK